MAHCSSDVFEDLQKLIYDHCSLRFSPSRLNGLKTYLSERMHRRELSSLEDYYRLLRRDNEEFDALVNGITTKETYFFRLPDQFKAITSLVIPRIEQRLLQDAQRVITKQGWSGPRIIPFRIWSTGCATGEEPYSIAMTILEGLRYPKAWKVDIMASDISREAVTTACTGRYESDVLKRIPVQYQKRYLRQSNGSAVMGDDLRERIAFRIFNLRNLAPRRGCPCTFTKLDGTSDMIDLHEYFDIVFCRNVMIYFDFAAQQQLIDRLYACLKPGGYLFTGDAELLHIYQHRFQTLECEGAYFYHKPEGQPC
ncbi:MAG: CheR family methyltransferase [bacterium]